MCCASAARISSSRNIGCAIDTRSSARSHVERPARFTTPYSVAIRCAWLRGEVTMSPRKLGTMRECITPSQSPRVKDAIL